MNELAELTGLINQVYDAALHRSRWPQLLQSLLTLTQAGAAQLYEETPGTPGGTPSRWSALEVREAPCAPAAAPEDALTVYEDALPSGTVFAASDPPLRATWQASRLYREWAQPQGYADLLGVVLDPEPGRRARLHLHRRCALGRAGQRERRQLQLLAPHLRRALLLSRAAQPRPPGLSDMASLFERLPMAVLVLDRWGGLRYANCAAFDLIATGGVLEWLEERPRLRDARASALLQALLAASGQGSAAGQILSVPASTDSDEVLIHMLPLAAETPPGASESPSVGSAAVVLLLYPRANGLPQRVHSAARFYALTPAESRVVETLMRRSSIGGIARALGIAEATVKTHLQHVFDKTNTRRQVDLIKLIAERVPPFST
jgi:DNA-binding CsgD family transcriptional regulator